MSVDDYGGLRAGAGGAEGLAARARLMRWPAHPGVDMRLSSATLLAATVAALLPLPYP